MFAAMAGRGKKRWWRSLAPFFLFGKCFVGGMRHGFGERCCLGPPLPPPQTNPWFWSITTTRVGRAEMEEHRRPERLCGCWGVDIGESGAAAVAGIGGRG